VGEGRAAAGVWVKTELFLHISLRFLAYTESEEAQSLRHQTAVL